MKKKVYLLKLISIYSNQKTGLTKLININSGKSDAFSKAKKPILWNIDNQITGDTIHLKSNTAEEKIDSLIVFNNAFLVSKDTIGTGYNQIKGLKLVGLFNKENKLKHVDIIKNAQSIYYFRNDKDELIGIDKSKSGAIEIEIINNEVDEIKKINQVDGKIYPESKFPKIEALLKGFNWRIDERIKSVNDLFKDDPKFTLPKIKGLEDYVPQDDFFDKDLSKKIRNFENPNIASKKIIPIFNRMVIFSTTDFSYHGNPDKVNCPKDQSRKSIAMYYYSNGRPSYERKLGDHSTIFRKRPGSSDPDGNVEFKKLFGKIYYRDKQKIK